MTGVTIVHNLVIIHDSGCRPDRLAYVLRDWVWHPTRWAMRQGWRVTLHQLGGV